MSELQELRQRLSALRGARARDRWGLALAGFILAILGALAGIAFLDICFSLSVPQRLIVDLAAIVLVVWAWRRYIQPVLAVREDIWDLALSVERASGIQSDLVAALQFETPAAANWGSPRLQGAVIHSVAVRTPSLNVFQGLDYQTLRSRSLVLGCALTLVWGLYLVFPGHFEVFANRLLLGSRHYPSRAVIDRIAVNGQIVLTTGEWPAAVRLPHGRLGELMVRVRGNLPDEGRLALRALGGKGTGRDVKLTPLTVEQRRDRLLQAASRLAELDSTGADLSGQRIDEIRTLGGLDATDGITELLQSEWSSAQVKALREMLELRLNNLSDQAGERHYLADLGRIIEPLEYQVYIGDAWTEPARIELSSVPLVEIAWRVTPPAYAGSVAAERSPHQLLVLEGSEVRLDLRSLQERPLARAWMALQLDGQTERLRLVPADGSKTRWQLPAESPFTAVRQEIRYQIFATDEHGMNLDAPIRGVIKRKPDRPPVVSLHVIHRVVLPNARPIIEIRAGDDYGLARLDLRLSIRRYHNEQPDRSVRAGSSETDPAAEGDREVDESARGPAPSPIAAEYPIQGDRLPFVGQHVLPLAEYKLRKGDRVELTVAATDYRGELAGETVAGETVVSEPLELEISDENGVLSAISEADEKSERRLSDIIRQQLGIGESK